MTLINGDYSTPINNCSGTSREPASAKIESNFGSLRIITRSQ